VSYESSAEPIKIGYLMDFLLPDGFPETYFQDAHSARGASKRRWSESRWFPPHPALRALGCHSATEPGAAGWARVIWWPAG
jgi:hypothetical protein